MEDFPELPDVSKMSLADLISGPLFTYQQRIYNLTLRIGVMVMAGHPVDTDLWCELIMTQTLMMATQTEISRRLIDMAVGG